MGNNTKKKVRSLPPLGKESKSRGKKKSEGGLDVQIPDRQRLIGSPAPQSMRRQNKIKAFKKSGSSSEFPTITLSAAENDSDEDDDDDGYVQKDSFIEVGQVGSGGLRSRHNSASNLSMTSLGSLVEIHRAMSARSGLTPPPRFLSMTGSSGNQVVSEITGLDTGGDATTENDNKEKETEAEHHSSKSSSHHGRSGRHRRNSNLPSLSPSRSGSSLASSLGHGGQRLPSKYSPLDPIKTSGGHTPRQHKHIGRSRRRSTS